MNDLFEYQIEGLLSLRKATRLTVQYKMVNINIIEEIEQPLLSRKKILFEIEHLGNGTPRRLEVKEKLSALQGASIDMTFIRNMDTDFGLPSLNGVAVIYNDEEVMKTIEPNWSKKRNTDEKGEEE